MFNVQCACFVHFVQFVHFVHFVHFPRKAAKRLNNLRTFYLKGCGVGGGCVLIFIARIGKIAG